MHIVCQECAYCVFLMYLLIHSCTVGNAFNQEFSILHHTVAKCDGLHATYTRTGTAFTRHAEDHHLYSAGHRIGGAEMIPPRRIHNLFEKQRHKLPLRARLTELTVVLGLKDEVDMTLSCPRFLRH